jgi:hypothetical protein
MRTYFARLLQHVDIFWRKRRRFLRGGVLLDHVGKMQRTG